MTPTQIARRSDALYADGTCGMTRRMLCDMVAQRESDLDDVMAENDRLWKQGERLFDKTLELGTDNAKLREENERFIVKLNAEHIAHQNVESDNAKLRELVKDIYVDMWALGEWLEPYEQRMRELGIEVEE